MIALTGEYRKHAIRQSSVCANSKKAQRNQTLDDARQFTPSLSEP